MTTPLESAPAPSDFIRDNRGGRSGCLAKINPGSHPLSAGAETATCTSGMQNRSA